METEDATREPAGRGRVGLALLVVDDDRCDRHALPSQGVVTVGRGAEADVRVKQPWISRRHAVLHVGELLFIEDVGSSYGVRVRGEAITKNERVPLAIGDVVELGSTMLVVQRRVATAAGTLGRDEFVAALREDCERAGRLELHLDVAAAPLPRADAQALEEALASGHSLSRVGRVRDTVVVAALRAPTATPLGVRLAEQLAARGVTVPIGTATFPADGSKAEALLERAMLGVVARGEGTEALVFADDASLALRAEIGRVGPTEANVVLWGETGVGKESLARLLHACGTRSSEPLVHVACGALADPAAERALFESTPRTPSLLERARTGTVLLDEIGDAPPTVQARLVASLSTAHVPFGMPRIVATSCYNLRSKIASGALRADLLFRIGSVELFVPPLRDRQADIPALARHFAALAAARAGKRRVPEIVPEAIAALTAYAWPGNVRELKQVVTTAADRASGPTLRREDFGPLDIAPVSDLRGQIAALERTRILDALERSGGNQSQAAKLLGMPRNTLLARLKEYDVPRRKKNRD